MALPPLGRVNINWGDMSAPQVINLTVSPPPELAVDHLYRHAGTYAITTAFRDAMGRNWGPTRTRMFTVRPGAPDGGTDPGPPPDPEEPEEPDPEEPEEE